MFEAPRGGALHPAMGQRGAGKTSPVSNDAPEWCEVLTPEEFHARAVAEIEDLLDATLNTLTCILASLVIAAVFMLAFDAYR